MSVGLFSLNGSSQIQSHHSYSPVSTLAKDKWAHWTQAPLSHLQSSDNHPTFISIQPHHSSASSQHMLFTSSLRITDRSFQYASFRLWNQLPAPLRQPRTNLSNSASPSSFSGISSISSIDSPLSSPITPSLFHSRLKTFLFCRSFPP